MFFDLSFLFHFAFRSTKWGCLENSDLENSDLRPLQNSDPHKTQTPGCLENSDPTKLRPLGVSKTQTPQNSDPWVSRKLRPPQNSDPWVSRDTRQNGGQPSSRDSVLSLSNSSSKLASLFGQDRASFSGGNESLTYTAPKQPKKEKPGTKYSEV